MTKTQYLKSKALAGELDDLAKTKEVKDYLVAKAAKEQLDRLSPKDLMDLGVFKQPAFAATEQRIKELFVNKSARFLDVYGREFTPDLLFEYSMWHFGENVVDVVDIYHSESYSEDDTEAYAILKVSNKKDSLYFKVEGYKNSYGGFRMNSVSKVEKKVKKIEVWEKS